MHIRKDLGLACMLKKIGKSITQWSKSEENDELYEAFSKRLGRRQITLVLAISSLLLLGLLLRLALDKQSDALLRFSILYSLAAVVFLFRKHLTGTTLLICLFFIFSAGSFIGFLQVGLASAGPYLFFVALVTAGVIQNQLLRWALTGTFVGSVATVFLLAVLRIRAPAPIDLEEHLKSPMTWALLGGVLAMSGVIMSGIMNEARTTIIDYQARLRHGIVNSMVFLVRNRDNETGLHLERCARFSAILLNSAKGAGLAEANKVKASDLSDAVKLHDVGKVAIPDSILLKDGKLTDAEFQIMKTHTTIGGDIIRDFAKHSEIENEPVLRLAEDIARFHHENWDGSGYPTGLKGTQIPLPARIMAIIDVYDALRSKRPYKNATLHQEAVGIMASLSEQKFDPSLFRLFLDNSQAFEAVYEELH